MQNNELLEMINQLDKQDFELSSDIKLLYDEIKNIEGSFDTSKIEKEIGTLKENISSIQLQKGDKGDKGEKGDKGDKGKDGKNGKDGKDGRNGIDGINGLNGKDGTDGSPDTPEQIVEKINTLENVIERKTIKGLDTVIDKPELDRAIDILDRRTQYLINKTVVAPSATTWGSITGTLSNQTDLQNALNAKQDTITTGTTAQYFRGDLSLATFPTLVSSFTNDAGYITSSALTGYVPTTRTLTINGTAYDLSANRTWSVGTVTSVAALTLGTSGTDLSSSVATGTTTPVITLNVPTASAANRGALSSTDWSTFNAKESPLTFSTGLTRTTNTITANLSTGIAGGQSAIGGTGTGDSLILKSTNGVGTSSSWIKGQVGNNGAIETSRQGVADSPDASGSGGTVTTSGGYTIHTFTTSGTFIVSGGTLSVDYLVVAGGGGGGGTDGGGGGAGGMKTGTGFLVAPGSYSITVGAGGTGGTGTAGKGTNGGDSIFSTITSTGGGGGGVYNNQTGLNGGSGGGGGANGGGSTAGGTGTAGQGNNGGSGKGPTNYAGAGGGGAGAVGGDAAATGSAGGGNGGAGSASSISGSSVTYAGGGGGGTYLGTAGAGGSGGGGAGTNVNRGTGTAGTVNTGGGGGGGGDTVGTGGAGGSGIVIIRYLTPTTTQRPVMGVNKTSPTAQLHIGAGVGNPYSAPLKFTSGTLLSAPEVGANEFLTDLYYKTITTGTVRGVSPVILTGRLTGKTSAQSTVVTYTPTEDSSFDISANVLVTTSTVHSFSVTCAYTDEGNTARTLTLGFTLVAGGTILTLVENANGAVPYMGIVQSIRAKANTAITITTTGTFTTVTYNVEAFITRKS